MIDVFDKAAIAELRNHESYLEVKNEEIIHADESSTQNVVKNDQTPHDIGKTNGHYKITIPGKNAKEVLVIKKRGRPPKMKG